MWRSVICFSLNLNVKLKRHYEEQSRVLFLSKGDLVEHSSLGC